MPELTAVICCYLHGTVQPLLERLEPWCSLEHKRFQKCPERMPSAGLTLHLSDADLLVERSSAPRARASFRYFVSADDHECCLLATDETRFATARALCSGSAPFATVKVMIKRIIGFMVHKSLSNAAVATRQACVINTLFNRNGPLAEYNKLVFGSPTLEPLLSV